MPGLFPSDPEEFAAIFARVGKLPKERSALFDDDPFLAWVKMHAHREREGELIAQLRMELEEVLGPRLEEEAARQTVLKISAKSRELYSRDCARWRAWASERGVSYLPAAPEALAMFILEACGAEDAKPAMATRLRTSIRLRHLLADLPDPTSSPFVKAVCRLITESSPRKPKPIAADIPPDDKLH